MWLEELWQSTCITLTKSVSDQSLRLSTTVEEYKRETQVQATLRSARYSVLWCCVPVLFCSVLSCPVLPYILPPLPWFGTSTSERNWMNLNRRFVRALILIDMLSRDEFCSSARLPWVAAHLPLPHPFMWLQQRFSTCGLGPHSGRRAARVPAGTPNSHFSFTDPNFTSLHNAGHRRTMMLQSQVSLTVASQYKIFLYNSARWMTAIVNNA